MPTVKDRDNKRLITIVQISDLHFGDLDKVTGDSDLSAGVPSWWQYWPFFDGYLGHHANALIHFADIFSHLRRTEDAILVVTGDLTATGSIEQFNLSKSYLEDSINGFSRGPVGLELQNIWLEGTIPGNHDHWPGNKGILGSPDNLYKSFPNPTPPLPIPVREIPLRNGAKIILAGVDTSSDVGSYGVNRILARGEFVRHLEVLRNQIAGASEDEVRVLLMHHSPQVSGIPLRINKKSRRVLKETVKQFNIRILLTGHAHKAIGTLEGIVDRGRQWTLLEARSGTTLQRDEVPPSFAKGIFSRYSEDKPYLANSFLVHRLYEESGHIYWEVTEYRRKNSGFKEHGPLLDDQGNNIEPVLVL